MAEKTAEGLAGFGYINRTGNLSRLAGMGVVPAARRAGVARRLLLALLDEAKARGEEAMMLEVIEQNPAAYALYRRQGFCEITRLCGWRRRVDGESVANVAGLAPEMLHGSSTTLEEISLTAASQLPSALEYPSLPWQVSRHAIAKLTIGRAYRTENAVVVIGDPETNPIRVHAVFSPTSNAMDWPAARQSVVALLKRYPDREFFTPAVFPEKFGVEIFAPLGFAREALTQFLMRHNLQVRLFPAWDGLEHKLP